MLNFPTSHTTLRLNWGEKAPASNKIRISIVDVFISFCFTINVKTSHLPFPFFLPRRAKKKCYSLLRKNVSLEFYVFVQLLIDRGKRTRNNVVSRTFFYRPIYYNQKNERRENISTYQNTQSLVRMHISTSTLGKRALHTTKSTASVLFRKLYFSIFHTHLLPAYFIAFFECDLFFVFFFRGDFKICFPVKRRKKALQSG